MYILLKKTKFLMVVLSILMLSVASNAFSAESEKYSSGEKSGKRAVIKAEVYAAKGAIKKKSRKKTMTTTVKDG